jgi:hypothetical protein
LLRSLQEIEPFLMEEDCGRGQGISWAVEPRRRRRRRRRYVAQMLPVFCE